MYPQFSITEAEKLKRDLVECPRALINRLIRRRVRSYDPFANAASMTPELRSRARSGGEAGLYRFKIDSLQYANCFEMSDELPDPRDIQQLCIAWDCD